MVYEVLHAYVIPNPKTQTVEIAVGAALGRRERVARRARRKQTE